MICLNSATPPAEFVSKLKHRPKWFVIERRKRLSLFVTRPRRLVSMKAMPLVWRRDVLKGYDEPKRLVPMNCRFWWINFNKRWLR
ncbi:MAG TPA: hypothetical protein DEQ73_03890 [Phycisphaerales bacterium]|nr:hypothetical protein [Phycisphaerales bacterium]